MAVTSISSGGSDSPDNLALAGASCSLRKGARSFFISPESGAKIPLFRLRKQQWDPHFFWQGILLNGRAKTGRASVESLKMNRSLILAIHNEEVRFRCHPPT